ncbi:hypothetical protein N7474_001915 [Penicillium riverlandense]|uniref:uncharacterized protein n=1 Tax=Penicillium riverlandense TaxID=1903569 RepID=UPI0025465B16|nr:uncharacterized protein N7474_001915 [Penicillium riverlandense]KAJ5833604.1 hypothetical protein N7474_001915 [Penicillium riverlandense]
MSPHTLYSLSARIFWHLLRIFLSFSLILLDNTILLFTSSIAHLLPAQPHKSSQDVHFYPKTILITGVGTAPGLALARAWHAAGHRVVGADVADLDLPVRSGGGMSRTLLVFYRIPKGHYISRLLDIIHREKVDVWIPCSPKVTPIEDATARQVVESRTSCKCIAFGTELTACLLHPDSFRHYLMDKGLPVLERHQVQSRDSIHKILNRSPTKSYQMRRLNSTADEGAVNLPKRTMSMTYSDVSEIEVTKDRPWVLQQQTRLGEFFADILVVRGHVHAIKVRLVDSRASQWGASRLDEALAVAIHKLMQSFAAKAGARMTGHVSVRLLVDQEFDAHSIRHSIHIAGCTPGAEAVANLLRDAPCPIAGYLAAISPDAVPAQVSAALSPPTPQFVSRIAPYIPAHKHLRFLRPLIPLLEKLYTEVSPFIFWENPLFARQDPLPWWWHVHVYQPMREIWLLMKQTREAGLTE